jgi:FkbM family methyltransferase
VIEFPRYGPLERWRRALRRRLLEPIMIGRRSFREVVLNALAARGHLVYCRVPEGAFFVDPSDRVIASWLMWHNGWQRHEIKQAAAILAQAGRLPTEAIFVDAGANIGTQTVYALRSGHFARAVAFEPEPNNARLLAMNIVANGFSDRATIIAKALGDDQGDAVLHLHPRNKGGHAIRTAPSHDGLDHIEVPMVRLDVALTDAGIAPEQIGLLWIDVEGYEPEVVRGLGHWLGRVPLAIEYAPRRYPCAIGADFRQLLGEHYSTLYRLTKELPLMEPIEALAEIGDIDDILVF